MVLANPHLIDRVIEHFPEDDATMFLILKPNEPNYLGPSYDNDSHTQISQPPSMTFQDIPNEEVRNSLMFALGF